MNSRNRGRRPDRQGSALPPTTGRSWAAATITTACSRSVQMPCTSPTLAERHRLTLRPAGSWLQRPPSSCWTSPKSNWQLGQGPWGVAVADNTYLPSSQTSRVLSRPLQDAARLLLSVTTDVHNLSSALQRPASATMRKPIMDADDWLDFVNLLGLGRLGPGGDSLPPGWQLACSGQYCLDLGQQVRDACMHARMRIEGGIAWTLGSRRGMLAYMRAANGIASTLCSRCGTHACMRVQQVRDTCLHACAAGAGHMLACVCSGRYHMDPERQVCTLTCMHVCTSSPCKGLVDNANVAVRSLRSLRKAALVHE
eukprot:361231-Chlamydomonas_euryale.AAC.9